MCGIAGLWDIARRLSPQACRDVAVGMAETLDHRGPDAAGAWQDSQVGLSLAHRRLSVLDLSPAGAQPMSSASERFVMSYNGEVYNHAELRTELEARGHRFRGHSDTEVIVEAFDAWGIEPTLERLNGMFAIAVWDRSRQILTLVRDRMGIKPLYWGWIDGALAFASELKALRRVPGWTGEIDRNALTAYLRYCYVPAPHSIYRGVSKLEPGTLLCIDDSGRAETRRFWDTRALWRDAGREPAGMTDAEAVDRLDTLLRDAVARRMVADVPVGAFLSGGIDSSLVVAEMQATASGPVHTFSIGFEEKGYDESPYARAVADHLGTKHTELVLTSHQAMEVVPDLPRMYDEPFADSSQIPTHLISRLARRNVTVALSGDGGDELFAGYTRYSTAQAVWQPLQRLPKWGRRAMAGAIGMLSPRRWDALAGPIPSRWRPPHFGQRLYKLKDVLAAGGFDDYYRPLLSHWPRPQDIVFDGREPPHVLDDPRLADDIPEMIGRMQAVDLLTFLPDDILTKVDRASMAVALEVRVPLLDHRVVSLAASLPPHMRIRGSKGKWLLRQVLARYVPKTLIERPKMGFGVPIDAWLRGPLREWGEELLDPSRLRREGFFDPRPIREKWEQHLNGTADWHYWLWDVLMFQAWHESWSA